MANGTAHAASAIATYRVLRELGRRSQPSYVAVHDDGSTVVLHRFTRDPQRQGELVSAVEMAILLRDARCLSKTWHPNLARVRSADLAGEDLHVAAELVEGVTLEDLIALSRATRAAATGPVLSSVILARVLLDVLAGLQALHSLRDGRNSPLGIFHGELCPANIVVGKDGVARIIGLFRPRPVTIGPRSEALGYASPETLAGEADQDARADLYAVGVMLWEALTQHRLYDGLDPARIAQRQRADEVVRPDGALADVAVRALAFDPALRFRTAQEMAAEIRAHAGAIAPGGAVAQHVVDLAGERMRARRAELDPRASGGQRPTGMPPPLRSGTHARVTNGPVTPRAPTVSQPPPAMPKSRSSSLATMTPNELRVSPPSAPDISTSYSPRPLPPRRGTGTLTPPPPPRRPTPSTRPIPRTGRSVVSSLPPPPIDDDDDLPGPRESTPDNDYVEQLAREVREAALSAAPPRRSEARALRPGPTTRTPFVVDVFPSAPPPPRPTTSTRAAQLPIVVGLAAAVTILIAIGTTIIVRATQTQAGTAEQESSARGTAFAPPPAEALPLPPASATDPTTAKPTDRRQ
ncbi:MAG TPA: protein kinase [Labilithrix sp.]|nr:protein kinase [Labilithrix sp.]